MAKDTKSGDDYKKVRDAIRKEPLEKVYLICGEDAHLREKIIAEIAAKRFKGAEIDPMSWEVYRSNETDAQKVIDAVRTVSLFGGPKAVVYRDIDKLTPAEIAKLAQYASAPARAHLILTAAKTDAHARGASGEKTSKSAPSKTAVWKQLIDNARVIRFMPLPENDYKGEINAYIAFAAEEKNVAMTPAAVDALKGLIGANRALLDRAVEKLSLAYGEKTPVTPEMVEEQVIDTRERNVFELTKAISARDLPNAMTALRVLLAQDREPVVINGILAMHARRLIAVKRAVQRGCGDAELAAAAGVSVYALREYKPAVSRYTLRELYRFHADVFDADRSLKSKPMPPELVFSRILLNLICK